MMKRSNAPVTEFTNGYSVAFGATLNRLAEAVRFSEATVATTLPRGGLQITQPRVADPVAMRQYVRNDHRRDIVAWEAIRRGKPVTLCRLLEAKFAKEAGAIPTEARVFHRNFLQRYDIAHYAAVPLAGPTLEGFPGVLQLYRRADMGDFTPTELKHLREFGEDLNDATARMHAMRAQEHEQEVQHHPCRQCAFSVEGMIFPEEPPATFDQELQENLEARVRERLAHFEETLQEPEVPLVNGGMDREGTEASFNGSNADRLLIPGESGENWTFRLALFPHFPAINHGRSGAVAVVSLQPDCETWSTLRPSDFAADDEISRLIPALQFMQQNFTIGSNLSEIARTVHLSPFHFHRRFTDLLGITPKHFLFDCQIAEAKRLLKRKEHSLAEIARQTGFAHQSHFTSRFKQATNLTPTKWRRLVSE